jgi:hypothetical protein
VIQDERGRATHMLFAVIDSTKHDDKPNDNHSSKAIGVEISPPRTVLVKKSGDKFLVALEAEKGFNPAKDVDPASLRFGAPSKVDFGKTGAPVSTRVNGSRLIAEFSAADCGFEPSDQTAKLLASDRKGGLVFGYAPLPDEPSEYPLLSADGRIEASAIQAEFRTLTVKVENFGLAKSPATNVQLLVHAESKPAATFTASLPALEPYEAGSVNFRIPAGLAPADSTPKVEITIGGEIQDHALKVELPKLP